MQIFGMQEMCSKNYFSLIVIISFILGSFFSYGEEIAFPSNYSTIGFIENKGQIVNDKGQLASEILAKAEGIGMDVYITTYGISYVFLSMDEEHKEDGVETQKKDGEIFGRWSKINLILKGASIQKESIIYERPSDQGVLNYYLPHCKEGIRNVKSYNKLTVKNIYPGIDWVLYNTSEKGMKYDFIVHPGADYNKIKLIYEGAESLQQKDNTSLIIESTLGRIQEGTLVCYEKSSGEKINSSYKIQKDEVSFSLNDYKRSEILVIDPPLTWATFYGAARADGPRDICLDNNGNVYITGYTFSSPFPTDSMSGAFYRGSLKGGDGDIDAFIVKFNSAGVRLWATYYGGSKVDRAKAITSDANGNIFILGCTKSNDIPTKNLAGAYWQPANASADAGVYDAFILKFDALGVLDWATYFGGTGIEDDLTLFPGWGADIDPFGNIYMIGYTSSTDFPLQNLPGAYNQSASGGNLDAFILKFNSAGACIWSTYFGGDGLDFGYDIAADAAGNVFITGNTNSAVFPLLDPSGGAYFQGTSGGSEDIFIAKFDINDTLRWSTYCGGNFSDFGNGIDIDMLGNVYVVGSSNSTSGFPVKNLVGAYNQSGNGGNVDMVVLKFDTYGLPLWASYYGGSGNSYAHRVTTDIGGNVYVVGRSGTNCIPVNPGGGVFYQGVCAGNYDAFIVQFTQSNSVYWATYYGGSGNDDYATGVVIDALNCLYITGEVLSNTGGPAMIDPGGGAYFEPKYGSDEGFIAKFCCLAPSVTVSAGGSICEGDFVELSASGASTYIWTPSTGLNSSTGSVITASPTDTTTYILIGANAALCPDTATTTVNVIPVLLTADAGNDTTIIYGENITLQASGGDSYSWSPSSGLSCVSCSNPIATPTVTTTYYVTVADSNGCSRVDSLTVTVDLSGCKTLFIPNAFSPNNDGQNEVLYVYNGCIKEMVWEIYDRWGEKVFHSEDPTIGWNGFYKGRLMETAVFFYTFKASLINEEELILHGNVSLIR